MKKYKVQVEIDQEWLNILGCITKNQEGFVWVKVLGINKEKCKCNYYKTRESN
jgi:hypothetical protein